MKGKLERAQFRSMVDRYRRGKANAAEKRFVELYLAKLESDQNGSMPGFDDSGLLQALTTHIGSGLRPKALPWRRYAAAAALILFAVGGYLAKKQLLSHEGGVTSLRTVLASRGKVMKITLSDGTLVWLNSTSKLTFPSSFAARYREVFLTGEAYFEVAKDKRKPFQVHTGELTTHVLGTHFNVKANPSTRAVEVTLIEGKVMLVASPLKGLSDTAFLRPNEKAVYLLPVMPVHPVSSARQMIEKTALPRPVIRLFKKHYPLAEEDALWIDGTLVFRNRTVAEIVTALSDHYHVQIKAHSLLAGRTLSVKVGSESVEEALLSVCHVLSRRYAKNHTRYTDQVQYKKQGSLYYIE